MSPVHRLAEGGEVRSGRLRLEILWPPRELLADPLAGADPNRLALVILARWRRFSMLLTADAEAEAVPIDPGPIDVLKVAHHGSDDAGLGALLDRTGPKLAVISVGADNPYGHPTPGTLATLAAHGVRTAAHRPRRDRRPRRSPRLGRGRHRAMSVGLNGSPNQKWGFRAPALSSTDFRPMVVLVFSRRGHSLSHLVSKPSLAGDRLLERMRSTTFALLGLTTAVGLGLVAFISSRVGPVS